MMREAAPLALTGGFEVDRKVGEVNGIAVEVWSAPTTGKAVLVVYPTVRGFTVIASGLVEDIEMLAGLGGCVLHALADVSPLLTGELFRGGRGIVETSQSDLRE